jgi:diguanylate cyclase (GGDEF)-like protein
MWSATIVAVYIIRTAEDRKMRLTRGSGPNTIQMGSVMKNIPTDEQFLKHYDVLQKSGALKQINRQQHRIHELEELLSNAVEIFNQRSPEELVHFLISCIVDKFIPSHLAFYFYDHDGGTTVKSLAFENLKQAATPVQLSNLDDYRSFFDHYPNPIDYQLFEYTVENKELAHRFLPLNPAIIVPLIGMEGIFGLIIIGAKVMGQEYSQEEMVLLDKLIKFASISLQSKIYYNSAVTDYKTRLYNHSYFIRRLQEEIAKVKRYGNSFSILAIDVDHFKRLNDKHGHLAGDKALFDLARTLEESLREEDVLSRFGGEEFFVLLLENSLPASVYVAERLRESVEKMNISHENVLLKITVSVGVSHVTRFRLADENTLIEQADSALYTSKKNGRNRVSVYNPGLFYKAHFLRP